MKKIITPYKFKDVFPTYDKWEEIILERVKNTIKYEDKTGTTIYPGWFNFSKSSFNKNFLFNIISNKFRNRWSRYDDKDEFYNLIVNDYIQYTPIFLKNTIEVLQDDFLEQISMSSRGKRTSITNKSFNKEGMTPFNITSSGELSSFSKGYDNSHKQDYISDNIFENAKLAKSVDISIEISKYINVYNNHFTNFDIESKSFEKITLQGEKGNIGEKGEKGDTGATGATGATGSPGADGADGADGVIGRDGKDGAVSYTLNTTTLIGTSFTELLSKLQNVNRVIIDSGEKYMLIGIDTSHSIHKIIKLIRLTGRRFDWMDLQFDINNSGNITRIVKKPWEVYYPSHYFNTNKNLKDIVALYNKTNDIELHMNELGINHKVDVYHNFSEVKITTDILNNSGNTDESVFRDIMKGILRKQWWSKGILNISSPTSDDIQILTYIKDMLDGNIYNKVIFILDIKITGNHKIKILLNNGSVYKEVLYTWNTLDAFVDKAINTINKTKFDEIYNDNLQTNETYFNADNAKYVFINKDDDKETKTLGNLFKSEGIITDMLKVHNKGKVITTYNQALKHTPQTLINFKSSAWNINTLIDWFEDNFKVNDNGKTYIHLTFNNYVNNPVGQTDNRLLLLLFTYLDNIPSFSNINNDFNYSNIELYIVYEVITIGTRLSISCKSSNNKKFFIGNWVHNNSFIIDKIYNPVNFEVLVYNRPIREVTNAKKKYVKVRDIKVLDNSGNNVVSFNHYLSTIDDGDILIGNKDVTEVNSNFDYKGSQGNKWIMNPTLELKHNNISNAAISNTTKNGSKNIEVSLPPGVYKIECLLNIYGMSNHCGAKIEIISGNNTIMPNAIMKQGKFISSENADFKLKCLIVVETTTVLSFLNYSNKTSNRNNGWKHDSADSEISSNQSWVRIQKKA